MLSSQGNRGLSQKVKFVDTARNVFDDVSVRIVSALDAPRVETFVRQVYFDGGDVLVCIRGFFLFTFADGDAVELHPGEMLVIYPGNYVTIQSKKAGGRLNYVILNGTGVADYFNSYGFYDRMRTAVEPQEGNFQSILRMASEGEMPQALLSRVGDVLTTFRQEIREKGGAALNDAIQGVHACIARGEVGLQAVCDELDVSRSYLNGLFLRNGLPAPGTFIRNEQLRRACSLLRTTKMTIAEVGKAVGIASPVYFTTYIRRLTGHTPKEIRAGREGRVKVRA